MLLYTSYLPCGGDQPWPYGAISDYTDSSDDSAEDARVRVGEQEEQEGQEERQ